MSLLLKVFESIMVAIEKHPESYLFANKTNNVTGKYAACNCPAMQIKTFFSW
jgi:hypothetical protein